MVKDSPVLTVQSLLAPMIVCLVASASTTLAFAPLVGLILIVRFRFAQVTATETGIVTTEPASATPISTDLTAQSPCVCTTVPTMACA